MELQDKYNHCVALVVELEDIIELQNMEIQRLEKRVAELEGEKKDKATAK